MASSEMWFHSITMHSPTQPASGKRVFAFVLLGNSGLETLNFWAESCQFHKNEEVEIAFRKMLFDLKKDEILHSGQERQMH
jgi:hypothetical protein